MDVFYADITILFFALAVAYVAGCDRLAPLAKASGPKAGDRS
jgi:hypothetical protein